MAAGVLVLAAPAQAGLDYIDGELKTGVAFHTKAAVAAGHRVGERMVQLRIDAQGWLGDADWRAEGRLRTDLRHLNKGHGRKARESWRPHADWRQLWISQPLLGGEATLGWQQVVWGRADELRVLDQLNPLDWRDGVTVLLNDARIALPMLRFQKFNGPWLLDTVVMLRGEADRYPALGTDWHTSRFDMLDSAQFDVSPVSGRGAHRAGIGIRLGRTFNRLDASWVFVEKARSQPAFRAEGFAPDGRVAVTRWHPVDRMYGFGVAFEPGYSLVLRSEFGVFPDYVADFSEFRTHRTTRTLSLMAVDYLWRDWLLSAQWHRDRQGSADHEVTKTYTLSLEGSFAADRGSLRLSAAHMSSSENLFQVRLGWRLDDHQRIGLQFDQFSGKPGGPLGQWRDRDRIFLSYSLSF